jgi:hypothetical protein
MSGWVFEPFPSGVPDHRQRIPDRDLGRVAAEHERAAEVSFPFLEDRAEITEHDVVRADHPIRRVLPVRLPRIRPGPHDALMPPAAEPEHVRGQIADRIAGLPLTDSRPDQAAGPHLSEQLRRPGLRIEQPRDPHVLALYQLRHNRDASR